jgi:hypothetical protein
MIRKLLLSCFIISALATNNLFAQQENIVIFPSAPYDRYIVYEMLALFWVGIVGLVVIISMKLKEVERIQNMGIDKAEKEIPLLD